MMLTCFVAVHQQQCKYLLAAHEQVYRDSDLLSASLVADVSGSV